MSFLSYRTIVDKILKDVANGKQATGDYSTTAKDFYIAPPVTQNYIITGFWINLVVATDFTANGYGSGVVLTNGISMGIEDDAGTVLHDFLDGEKIKSNSDWERIVDIPNGITKGLTNAHLTGDTSFLAMYGAPIKLFGVEKHRLVLTFNDDFSVAGGVNPMVAHQFGVVGGIEMI